MPKYFTPPEVATMFRVLPDKVRGWIASGQLRAVNIAENPNGERPRWRIEESAIEDFKLVRGALPPSKPVRRKRKAQSINAGRFYS